MTLQGEAGPKEAYAELVSASIIEPVALGTADERTWADCDLASLAENRLGEPFDPRGLDERLRQDLRTRATTEPCGLPRERRFDSCFWLLEGGQRVGTVALESAALGTHRLRLSSLYLLPDQRGKGLGSRVLQRLKNGLGRHGFGIRLETNWCWLAAVRFYLREGFMLHGWKRELTFSWDTGDPPLVMALEEETASASVDSDGARVVLVRAERAGERLVIADERPAGIEPHLQEVAWCASSTLWLWLALRGWPLVRSPEAWERERHNDFGSPEALAYKIVIWEAWAQDRGYRVETPRIPGLHYASWAELQAEWSGSR
ncbi:MAG TPA: GNAT family N-acetyltransferase [Polyangiaceae bacterium]|nr:GNAT family N-acetyltransferase [Polyangiaceae bacterium]